MRKLLDGLLDWHCYDPDQGFVGIGSNLVYLNPQLLNISVNVKGTPGRLSSGYSVRWLAVVALLRCLGQQCQSWYCGLVVH